MLDGILHGFKAKPITIKRVCSAKNCHAWRSKGRHGRTFFFENTLCED
jgi:hypothetical protein